MYNQPPPEVEQAYLPAEPGVLPLIVRAGTPIATYRLKKIETPQANGDQIYFHVEKFCTMDALWYPQWLTQPILPVDERPLASGCAGGDGASGTDALYGNFCQDPCAARSRPTGNPLSTWFHWRAQCTRQCGSGPNRGRAPGMYRFKYIHNPQLGQEWI